MSEFTLTAASPLGGHAAHFDGAELAEVTDRALVSFAVPLAGGDTFAAALGIALPAPGHTARSGEEMLLMGLGPDQGLAMLPLGEGPTVEALRARLGGLAYLTEQTDAWVILRLMGPKALAALERICPVDLHLEAFPEGRVARTVMEHLGAIVLREGPESFLLMSASSSARSFLHAVETSLRNVC